jgi:hypothetical protein
LSGRSRASFLRQSACSAARYPAKGRCGLKLLASISVLALGGCATESYIDRSIAGVSLRLDSSRESDLGNQASVLLDVIYITLKDHPSLGQTPTQYAASEAARIKANNINTNEALVKERTAVLQRLTQQIVK